MELYTLKINVTNQRLSFGENPPEIYSGDQNIDFVEFTFTDDTWNFPNIWAIISRQKGGAYQIALDDNKVMIPAEVMQKRGYVYIGLMATDGENVQTSSILQYSIRQGAANVDTISPSPNIYEQFLADLDAYQEAIHNLQTLAATADTLPAGSDATASYDNGVLHLGIPKGDTGATGNGIQSISKTGTSGSVDTYTITFTNGSTTTYTVTNGEVTQGALDAVIQPLENDVDDLKSDILTLHAKSGYFNFDDFTLGAILTTGGVMTIDYSYTTIICTKVSLLYPEDITITPKTGVRMNIFYTDGLNYAQTSTGWVTEAVTIPKNTFFACNFRRVSDAGAITVESFIKNYAVSPSPLMMAESIALAHLDEPIYVSSSSGNDWTGNGTKALPYKTIGKAVAVGAKEICVKKGLYIESITISGRNIKIFAEWETFASGSVTDRPKVIIDGNNSIVTALTCENCGEVILEDVVVQNCTGDGALINKCQNVKLQNCEFNNNGVNGIVINYSNGVIKDCQANYNGNDGFNMNYFGDTQFYNCSGHDNVDDGISHHQGCTGCINGGEWYNNGKGGVASPAHGAQVDILNIYSHDNAYGIYANADADTVARTFRVWNSVLVNNSQYGITSKRNTCYLYNCKIAGNAVGQTTAPSGGHIYTLD